MQSQWNCPPPMIMAISSNPRTAVSMASFHFAYTTDIYLAGPLMGYVGNPGLLQFLDALSKDA